MKGGIEGIPGPMGRFLRGVGIDVRDARRAGLQGPLDTMVEACKACVEADRCVKVAEGEVPDYCPNAGRFALADGYLTRWRIAE